jgi:aspartate/methionine/tyrosine aminotransferase
MERLSVRAIAQLPKITARASIILRTNRKTLNQFWRERPDIEAVHTDFGTTSFPRLRNLDVDKLCSLLMDKYDTAVVPGQFFESPQHIRIGICCEPENFSAGISRLGRALDELRP